MIDPWGVEWVPAAEVPGRVPRVKAATLRSWVHRGRVRGYRAGGVSWVAWEDVLRAEAEAHLSGWLPGRRARRRASAGHLPGSIAT